MEKIHAPLGSVVFGTLRTSDLLRAFSTELDHACEYYIWHGTGNESEVFSDYRACASYARYLAKRFDLGAMVDHESESIIEELSDHLNDFAAPLSQFSAHPDYGADFGFWLVEDWEDRVHKLEGFTVQNNGAGIVRLLDNRGRLVWESLY